MKRLFGLLLIFSILPLFSFCSGKQNANEEKSEVVEQEKDVATDDTVIVQDSVTSVVAENVKTNSETKIPEIPANGLPTVLDFNAVWCGPCQAMKPMFAEFEEIFDGFVNFVPVDIDEYTEFAKSYKVEAVPTFVFLNKDGVEVNRLVGAKRRAEMEQAIMNLVK